MSEEIDEKEAAEEQAEKEFLRGETEEEFHHCHFCGEYVKDGKDAKGERHWLSDCRPDLVEHEIGDTCTWAYKRKAGNIRQPDTCYAYQNADLKWTEDHVHFSKDGPM